MKYYNIEINPLILKGGNKDKHPVHSELAMKMLNSRLDIEGDENEKKKIELEIKFMNLDLKKTKLDKLKKKNKDITYVINVLEEILKNYNFRLKMLNDSDDSDDDDSDDDDDWSSKGGALTSNEAKKKKD